MKTASLAALLVLAVCAPAPAQDLEVHFIALDTHGESILVRTPGGRALLIDGGLAQAGPQVARYLADQGVRELDLVLSTHDDPDHFGGLPSVLEAFPVRAFAESPVRAGGLRRALRPRLEQALEQARVPRAELSRGARLELEDGVTLEVLAPSAPWFTRPGRDLPNDDSLVLRLTHGRTRLLLVGDATRATEERLLAAGLDLTCDVLKVGHHGLDTSSSAAFLAATRARTAVVCCAPGSGAPARPVLERLRAAGISWYRTDRNGTIVLRSTGDPSAVTARLARGRADDARDNPFPGVGALVRSYTRLPAPRRAAGELAGRVGRAVYHRRTCLARRLIPSWQVVTFRSEAEAAEAGRRPCALCRP